MDHLFPNIVTLNCDIGHSFGLYNMGDNDTLFELTDIANVACGFNDYSYAVMADTANKARVNEVQVGAQPFFPDLQVFGQRKMKLTDNEVKNSIMYQVGKLKAILDAKNMNLNHIKPHGSLYEVSIRNMGICRAILEVCQAFGVPLLGMVGTFHESLAKEYGVPFLSEFFADLNYGDDGMLIIARVHETIDPQVASDRVWKALHERKYCSANGKEFEVHPNTITFRTDTPDAVKVATAVRRVVDTFNMLVNTSPGNGIKTVLVANRGEIACRIMRTCKKMGIKTVAIYEELDENSMHSLEADESTELPKGETYTSINSIVDICKQFSVDAVHPGYGFLSENPVFCEAVEEANVIFLGPTSETMTKFGLKHEARDLAMKAGVPVIPGTGLLTGVDHAVEEATRLTYPLLIKATSGGGGIGIQICEDDLQLKKLIIDCQHLADKHFGNSGVYLEKYYPQSRHIEVQVFGNGCGQVIHMGERECSVQRRFQKVIEETPSPFLLNNPQLREELCEAAVRLSRSVNYRSAGTVEFLVVDEGQDGRNTGKFFFLEMNVRLQVEHGITEMVNGVDLVEWMILQGNLQKNGINTLNLSTFGWKPTGHAIEVRIYAENPSLNFQPSPGLLTQVRWPISSHVRVDTWVKLGTHVTTGYDPLIAKLMVYGKDRVCAIENLSNALLETIVAGPFTNLDYLSTVIQNKEFTSGNTLAHILKHIDYTPQVIRVLQGGSDTTVQDLPSRIALRVYGIQPNGPLDNVAFRVANILVGNEEGTAGLEITIQGPKLYFYVPSLVAVTGANMEVLLLVPNKQTVKKVMWSRFFVPAGSTLTIGKVPRLSFGCRCYLAIYGGLNIPDYLGSKSTYAAFGYGGFQGRILRAGDMLPLAKALHDSQVQTRVAEDLNLPTVLIPTYQKNWLIKVMPGPHADPDYVKPEGMDEFFTTDWGVHYNCAKVGVRLSGPTPKWVRTDGGYGGSHPSNVHDTAYGMGSVNFTGDFGVLLTCDGPTQGGFACPMAVISTELWKIGQLCPENTIRFQPVTIDDALEVRESHQDYFAHIKQIATYYPKYVPTRTFPLLTNTAAGHLVISKNHRNRAILDELPVDIKSGRPYVQYRQIGDCYVIVEYGNPNLPIDLNLYARAFVLRGMLRLHVETKTQKAEDPLIPGTFDAAPAVRSLMIRYDSSILPQSTLVECLKTMELDIPDISNIVFPSREIRLPLLFDDRWTREAIMKYMQMIRKEASYLPSNIEFIAKNNGLVGGKEDVLKYVVNTPYLNVGVGFFLGCPSLLAINPLDRLQVPKYNPTRVYTPPSTVGIGGGVLCIYALPSPGGYQMYGRTIQTFDTFGSVPPFTPHQPWLLTFFDKVTFYSVSEDEMLLYRRLAVAGKFKYDIRQATFDMAEYNKLVSKVSKEVAIMDKKYQKANSKMIALETDLLKKYTASLVNAPTQATGQLPEGQEACKTFISGCVKTIKVQPGIKVTANQTVLCVLQAMKTDQDVISTVNGTVVKVMFVPGQLVSSDDIVCVVQTH